MLLRFFSAAFLAATFLTTIFLSACTSSSKSGSTERQPESIREAIDIMRAAAAEMDVEEFTFTQETIRFNLDGSPADTSLWYEAMQFPSNFRIDFAHPDSGSAVIYTQDTSYFFARGNLAGSRPEIQEFMVIEGGVHSYSTSEILQRLSQLRMDTTAFMVDTVGDQILWIMGSEQGLRSWFDAEHHSLVRQIGTMPDGRRLESKFSGFETHGDLVIETRVEIFLDGVLVQDELYQDINVNPNLPASLFDPQRFGEEHWVKTRIAD